MSRDLSPMTRVCALPAASDVAYYYSTAAENG